MYIASQKVSDKSYGDVINALKRASATNQPFELKIRKKGKPMPAASPKANTKATPARKKSAPAAAEEEEGLLTVMLPNAKGKSLGLGFKIMKGSSSGAAVKDVKEAGAASEWNSAHPDEVVAAEDVIVYVAGVNVTKKNFSDIIKILKKHSASGRPFELKIRRGGKEAGTAPSTPKPTPKRKKSAAKNKSESKPESEPAPYPVAEDNPQDAGLTVLLPNAKGKSLGMGFKAAKGNNGAMIDAVKAAGAASEWNSANPGAQVKAGLEIASVAGTKVDHMRFSDVIVLLKKASATSEPFEIVLREKQVASTEKKASASKPTPKKETPPADKLTVLVQAKQSLGVGVKEGPRGLGASVKDLKDKGAVPEFNDDQAVLDMPVVCVGDRIWQVGDEDVSELKFAAVVSTIKKFSSSGKSFDIHFASKAK